MDHATDLAQYHHLPWQQTIDSTSHALPRGRRIGAYFNMRRRVWEVLELDTDSMTAYGTFDGTPDGRTIAEMEADVMFGDLMAIEEDR
jgi:hypothetical protein